MFIYKCSSWWFESILKEMLWLVVFCISKSYTNQTSSRAKWNRFLGGTILRSYLSFFGNAVILLNLCQEHAQYLTLELTKSVATVSRLRSAAEEISLFNFIQVEVLQLPLFYENTVKCLQGQIILVSKSVYGTMFFEFSRITDNKCNDKLWRTAQLSLT